MKCNKGMFCDWCEHRDFTTRENTADKPVDYCNPPDGKCPVKSNNRQALEIN